MEGKCLQNGCKGPCDYEWNYEQKSEVEITKLVCSFGGY